MQRDNVSNGFDNKKRFNFLDVLAFVIPVTQVIKIHLVGELYGPDIAYPVVFLFLFFSTRREKWPRELRTGIMLAALWFVGAVISDIYQSTSWEDIARGWSKILLFVVILLGIYQLVRNDLRRIILLILGEALGITLEALVNPDILAAYDPWKFGVGAGVTIAIIYLACIVLPANVFWRLIGATIIIATSFLSLALNVRALFGFTFLTGIFAAAKIAIDSRKSSRRLTVVQFAVAIVFILTVVQGMFFIYSTAASQGWLGLDAQDKYEAQTRGGSSVLMGGRDEILVSIQAVVDSPIIGHGSWARDIYYVAMLRDLLEAKGTDVAFSGNIFDNDVIPAHSHLMGSWVESGVLGGVFWIWALIISFRASFAMVNLRRPEMPFVAFVLISLVWNILFSPFAAFMRFQTAAALYLAIVVIGLAKRGSQEVTHRIVRANAPANRYGLSQKA